MLVFLEEDCETNTSPCVGERLRFCMSSPVDSADLQSDVSWRGDAMWLWGVDPKQASKQASGPGRETQQQQADVHTDTHTHARFGRR